MSEVEAETFSSPYKSGEYNTSSHKRSKSGTRPQKPPWKNVWWLKDWVFTTEAKRKMVGDFIVTAKLHALAFILNHPH